MSTSLSPQPAESVFALECSWTSTDEAGQFWRRQWHVLVVILVFLGVAVRLPAQILRQPIPDRLVVLTFDDGAVTHADYVAPLLKKYGFGATFFVCEFPPDFEDKTKYMSWAQIRQLSEMGFEVANHTGRHTHVDEVDDADFTRELETIEDRCAANGIPRPVTFAYPAYAVRPGVDTTLRNKGYQFARIGGSRPYDPLKDHPYLIPSYSTTGDNKDQILGALKEARDGKIVVLTIHGVPDLAHDWVTTPPALFETYMEYLKDQNFTVIGLNDLQRYIDPEAARRMIIPHFILQNGQEVLPEKPVRFTVDLNKKKGPFDPVWAWFGYDEPNYTYMKDGRKLLSELAELSPAPVYIRTHSLLNSGDGRAALKWGSTNVYTEDAAGKPVYTWTLLDSIVDTYVSRGLKPLMEIGFMPEALSSQPEPYRHHWKPGDPYNDIYTGWAYPPKDYRKWAELVYRWVRHSVERYGQTEVETWYWELWNEPNIGYWKGTTEEYIKLYDFTSDAVKRALPTARIGGPHVTGPSWDVSAAFLRAFLDHCLHGENAATGKTGAPLDYIGFHAKGAPRWASDHIRMNLGAQLRDISGGFEIVASYPEFRRLPIIIGESDPEGCAACPASVYPNNDYRNGTLYPSYTAAAFARKIDLADHFGVHFKGAVTWAFEFEDQRWFDGFRDLATNGVDKPVLNVFRMFGMMSGSRVDVVGDWAYDYQTIRDSSVRGAQPDIGILAVKDDHSAALLVWNYHDDDLPSPNRKVDIRLEGIPAGKALLQHYRIDEQHSNAYSAWQKMGSPQHPNSREVKALEAAGKLAQLEAPVWITTEDGKTSIRAEMPRHSVSLLKLTW